MKNCAIITGGSGFIGSHVVERLTADPLIARIIILDLVPPAFTHNKVRYCYCDIRKPIDIQLDEGCRYTLYHLAALCKEPGYEWDEYFRTNYEGTRNICGFALRMHIADIIFTSTMMVFNPSEKKQKEEDLTAPRTAYGLSKLLAERVLLEWEQSNVSHRLRIVRPGVVFGLGEKGNFTRLAEALKKKTFVYVGRKDTIKGSIYVKEIVQFLLFVSTDRSERTIYNFVFPEPDTIESICTIICDVMEWRKFVIMIPYGLALIVSYAFEALNAIGLRNPIHHRRIEKLNHSTYLSVDAAIESGYIFSYTLKTAISDWKHDCKGQRLY
ncbi:MAG TPA: NAD(P)-dependent oxidoreductase [Bacteroidota bacterium]|nr:NAD(P)-dependent oxidoreductase [Bacteroidota bacterium]